MDIKPGDRVQIAKKGGEMWIVLRVWPNEQITIQGTRANSFGQVAKRTIDPDKVVHHYPQS
ncbi:Uncharacterised protein [Mycobacteroides abscessus subsp. bolletii]|nr:Uncharacterised protein [Mycobacteroides abscessus subsp. bolletii]SKT75546.1 Uncharacterised protein [Mycobacteroides abscessus subsp. bolletii]SLD35443.1 Uncharacterised protein [Mycobacteroides abscessus subsp. bolletii]SLF79406.1 Uncharacterised protein [Mycobacteroides abscessus subsp. bolletii]